MQSLPSDQIQHEDTVSLPFSSATALLMLLLLIFICSLIGSGLVFAIGSTQGMDLETIFATLSSDSALEHRNFVRTALLLNHLTMFVLPAIGFGLFLYRKECWQFFGLSKFPPLHLMGSCILLMLISFPLVELSFWINQQLPLPSWATDLENSTGEVLKGILMTDSIFELLFNLLIIAVIPGIGEELIFRGILQQHLAKISKSMTIGIWSSAFLFSAMHLQFEGFIPRMMLGVLLAYVFYWTANLWLPIIAHIFYNGVQVFAQYLYAEEISDLDLEQAVDVSWPLSIFSIIFVLAIGYYLRKSGRDASPPQVQA